MSGSSISGSWRAILERRLLRNTVELSGGDLGRATLVFSPHFDDETLGCGGTILRMVRQGAEVGIVFMTDGSQSHSRWMEESKLREIRRDEGVAAVGALGVKPEQVSILGFSETRLCESFEAAVGKVMDLLTRSGAEQVFVPYLKEPLMWSRDHVETTRIVLEAVRRSGRPVTVCEYPIWAWFHFPWIPLKGGALRWKLWNTLYHGFGLRLLAGMNARVAIAPELESKRNALWAHRSQMEELVPGVGWPTLGAVADGGFLPLFFKEQEYFRVTRPVPGADSKTGEAQ